MSKYKIITRHFCMPEQISELINQYAKMLGMGYSEFVREAIRHYVRYLKGGGKT